MSQAPLSNPLGTLSLTQKCSMSTAYEKSLRPLAAVSTRYELTGDESFFNATIKDVEHAVGIGKGFRHQAESTQERQNRHLELYRRFVCIDKRLPLSVDDQSLDELGFPKNAEDLAKILRRFLISRWMTSNGNVGGVGPRPYMKYQSLTQYRDSMLFWSRRIFVERG